MRQLLILLGVIMYTLPIQSQYDRCDYVAIDFEDITPEWRHLTIDSSIIGYTDTTGIRQTFYQDGMQHLLLDDGSFIHEGYLYSLVEIDIDRDVSGAVIEKIDLETGELMWQIVEDIRTAPYREQVFHAEVVDGQLLVYGLRQEFLHSQDTSFGLFERALLGFYYRKTYDIDTGAKISEFTPPIDDSLAIGIVKLPKVTHNYFSKDSLVNFFDKRNFEVGSGYNLTRSVIDTNGHLVGKEDTVVVGRFSDRIILDAFIPEEPQLTLTPENTYLYIENYSPREDVDETFEGIISEYDRDFNLLREVDIKSFGLTEFSQLEILEVTEDRILFTGCTNGSLGFSISPCDEFFFILDRAFNLIREFYIADNELSSQRTINSHIKLIGKDNVYIFNPIFEDVGQSLLELYTATDEGNVELVNQVTITEPEWVGFVDKFFVMDDGDILMRFTHSCYIDGDKRSWHPEWFRIDKADFLGTTSTDDLSDAGYIPITISPNPVAKQLTIELKEVLDGKIEIHDMTGRQMMSHQILQNRMIELPIAEYSPGTYLLTVTAKNGKKAVRKFVKI